MERFVEFSLHEYMDMYPTQTVRTFKGENPLRLLRKSLKSMLTIYLRFILEVLHPLLKCGLKKKQENGLIKI